MESLDYWRLCDELSVVHAALLLVGSDPSSEAGRSVESWKMHERPDGYEAAKTAITNALRLEKIKGTIIPIYQRDFHGVEFEQANSIDVAASRLNVESLRQWLQLRGINTGFFFPMATDATDYLDRNNPRYAPKLAAAIRAWQAVSNPAGNHPKKALLKWLREHASEFDLTDDEGKTNETGIEEVAKVANWQPNGGAPKTPG